MQPSYLKMLFLTLIVTLLPACSGAFVPQNRAELKAAIDACIQISPDGNCPSYSKGAMGSWDVSLVTDMSKIFKGKNQFNADISNWDTSSVTNMHGIFSDATAFNSDISKWDVSKVTLMTGIFVRAPEFNGDLSKWDTSSVTNMHGMFYGATAFNGDLSAWDVSKVTNMANMFLVQTSFHGDISKWDVSRVTNMQSMFNGATAFNGDVSKWDVSKVTTMENMFRGATAFSQTLCGAAWLEAKADSSVDKSLMFEGTNAGSIAAFVPSNIERCGLPKTTTTTPIPATTPKIAIKTTVATTPSACAKTTYEKVGNGVCVDSNGEQLFRYEKDTYSAAECQAICDQHDECEGWQTEQSLWCSILVSKEIPNFKWPATPRSTGQGVNFHGPGKGVLGQAVFGSDPKVQSFWKCYKKTQQPCVITTATTTTTTTKSNPKTCSTYQGNGFWGVPAGARSSHGRRSVEQCRTLCEQSASCVGFNVVGATASDTSQGRCDTLTALGQWQYLAGNTNPAYTCEGGNTPKTCYCVGDPHCGDFAGAEWTNHDLGWKTLYHKGNLKIEADQAGNIWGPGATTNQGYRVTYKGNVAGGHLPLTSTVVGQLGKIVTYNNDNGALGQTTATNGVIDFPSPAVKLVVQVVDFNNPKGTGGKFMYNIFVSTTETDGVQGVCAGDRRRRLDESKPRFPSDPVVTEKQAEAACADLKPQFDNCVYDVRMANDPSVIDLIVKSFKEVEETVERLAQHKTTPAPTTTSTSFRGPAVSAGTLEVISAVVTCLVAAVI